MRGLFYRSLRLNMPRLQKNTIQSIFVGAECTLLYIYTSTDRPDFFLVQYCTPLSFSHANCEFCHCLHHHISQPLSSPVLEYFLTIYIHITLFHRPLVTVQSYTVFDFYIILGIYFLTEKRETKTK